MGVGAARALRFGGSGLRTTSLGLGFSFLTTAMLEPTSALALSRCANGLFISTTRASTISEPAMAVATPTAWARDSTRSEEHTSELQSLMRISYAVFCLKKKKKQK